MRATYRSPAVKQLLEEQLSLPSRSQRIQRAASAESLLAEIDPEKSYSLSFIRQKITDSPALAGRNVVLDGRSLRSDLRVFVEDLSDAAEMSAEEAGERALTIEELAAELNVSTKTVSRWRQQGLVSRRLVFDGDKRVGFLQSSVDRFVARNRDKVRRGSRFSQLDKDETKAILGIARDLAQSGLPPAEITSRLSKSFDRDADTIRSILRQHDRDFPDNAVLPRRQNPLTNEARDEVFGRYRTGESIDCLAKRFGQAKNTIRRVVREIYHDRIMDLNLDYIPNPLFDEINSKSAERPILAPIPVNGKAKSKVRLPGGLPAYLESMYHVPLLTREQEAHLFRKMNFLKYKASKLREQLDPASPRQAAMKKIESLYNEAVAVKNELVRRNLRLVASIAKRLAGPTETFFELISDGNISLMRAVDKFDYSRGFKFSTYATWAIRRNFARTIPDEFRRRERFSTGCDEYLENTEEAGTDQFQEELAQSEREASVQRVLACLDERERLIISDHFGLSRGQEPLTLERIGKRLGISKERVRQLKTRAIEKMQAAARREKIELPAVAV
jgi:RNA polymerase sigma factor (sigma-70 family)